MTTMTVAKAREHLADLLAKAADGEKVVIVREDGRAFTVTPAQTFSDKKRGFVGIAAGKIWIADDFDEIPEGFEDYMPDEQE